MKKIILCIICLILFVLTGCELVNTPTSRVEALLSQYQMLDKDISTNYLLLSGDSQIDENLKNRYQKVIENQYRNLSYEIREEEIDGDTATVTTQIEVTDFRNSMEKYRMDDYSREEYHKRVLDSLEQEKEKITYTINFKVTKNESGDWIVNGLTQEESEKLLGIYFE